MYRRDMRQRVEVGDVLTVTLDDLAPRDVVIVKATALGVWFVPVGGERLPTTGCIPAGGYFSSGLRG